MALKQIADDNLALKRAMEEESTVVANSNTSQSLGQIWEDIPMASTSGRVHSPFWIGRPRRSRHSICSPIGKFYAVNQENGCAFYGGEGEKLEQVTVHNNHTICTCFEQSSNSKDKSVRVSSLHKLDGGIELATQYINDLQGNGDFHINATYEVFHESTLSTCFHTDSTNLSVMEVNIENEKLNGHFVSNMRTGGSTASMHAKNFLPGNTIMDASFVTNLSNKTTLRLEGLLPMRNSGTLQQSFQTDFLQERELCLKGSRSLGKERQMELAFCTTMKENIDLCMELKQELKDHKSISLSVATDCHVQLSLGLVIPSFSCTYRDSIRDGKLLNLEWKHGQFPHNYMLVKAALGSGIYSLSAEAKFS